MIRREIVALAESRRTESYWVHTRIFDAAGSRDCRRNAAQSRDAEALLRRLRGGLRGARMTDLEPWRWPESRWRAAVNQVRAGAAYRPNGWADGARCAFAISFDSDHETNELQAGGNSIGRMAWGQYGARVGVPRILGILEKYDVPATFFVPAVSALLHEEEQRRIVAAGHEIGIHGWIHELNSLLPPDDERDLMLRAADTLEKVTRVRPVGLRTPSWDFSPNTLRLEKEMGLLYDSSLMADEDCYELLLDGEPTGVVELPVEWVRDDAPYFMMNRSPPSRPHSSPADVFEIYRREFDEAWEDGGLFQLTCHPHIIGYRSRSWIVEDLISHAKTKGGVLVRHSLPGRRLRQGPRGLRILAGHHSKSASVRAPVRRTSG